MSTPNDGGPAFPHGPLGDTMRGEDGREWHQYPAGAGMSPRDWFLGQALAGLMANPDTKTAGFNTIAVAASLAADAMLAELAKREGGGK